MSSASVVVGLLVNSSTFFSTSTFGVVMTFEVSSGGGVVESQLIWFTARKRESEN